MLFNKDNIRDLSPIAFVIESNKKFTQSIGVDTLYLIESVIIKLVSNDLTAVPNVVQLNVSSDTDTYSVNCLEISGVIQTATEFHVTYKCELQIPVKGRLEVSVLTENDALFKGAILGYNLTK